MKKTLIALLILILIAAAVWLWKNPQTLTVPMTDDTLTGDVVVDDTLTGDVVVDDSLTGDVVVDDSLTGDTEDTLSPELQAKLEEQASIGLSGEDITEEDIKLIEEILDQVTKSVE